MPEGVLEQIHSSPEEGKEVQIEIIKNEIKDLNIDELAQLIQQERLRRIGAEKMSLYDVTGVLTHKAFLDQATANHERSRRSGAPYAVSFVDMGNFKVLNDTLGHETGDQVLRAVASTIQTGFRAQDIVGRVGGDEFAVVLVDYAGERETFEQTRTRLQNSLRDSLVQYAENSNTLINPDVIEMDIGMSEYRGQQSFLDVMAAADANMYEQKRRRKSGGQ